MHRDYERADRLSHEVIGAAIEVHPIHKAQLLSYMKLMDIPLGLLINFHELRVVDGLSRLILRGADKAAKDQ